MIYAFRHQADSYYRFLPFALLLMGSFWGESTTAGGILSEGGASLFSLRRTQISMAHVQSKSELQNSRFLKIIGDNAPLKAGMQLMLSDPESGDARRHGGRPVERTLRGSKASTFCWRPPRKSGPWLGSCVSVNTW